MTSYTRSLSYVEATSVIGPFLRVLPRFYRASRRISAGGGARCPGARFSNSPDAGTGQYFNVLEVGRANSQAYDPEARARLRGLSLALTGLD